MSATAQRLLLWSPRILGIAIVIFLGIFATQAFHEGRSFWSTVLAFLMQLLPAAIVALILWVGWRREWLGAILFSAAAILYCTQSLPQHPSWAASIALPLLLIAILFLAAWFGRQATGNEDQGTEGI